MASKQLKTTVRHAGPEFHGYEFLGPPGAFVITFGLPLLMYAFTFFCNDTTGCPVPSLLSPSTLTLEKLKKDAGWPVNGFWGLCNWEVFLKVCGYYVWSIALYFILPGDVREGQPLTVGGAKLKYKFNTWNSSLFTLAILAAGTYAQGPDFAVWRFINGNYLQILTANIIIAYALAVFVYVRSFSVKPGNTDNRELAGGGVSGNMLYDFFIGRELNPPVTIPGWGALDIKTFMEVRPGLLGWIILDFAFVMKQYKTYGIVTDSIILTTLFHTLYVLDCFWVEHNILTQIDITTDGFGFMLSFGDLVWVPFIYSTGARYLSVFPLVLGPWGSLGVLAPLIVGYSIFRLTNTQKDRFRTNPTHPSVSHLTYIETSKGTKLITSGYWGIARHFNYFGDLVQGWAYVLPTGVAGYIIQRKSLEPTQGQSSFDKSFVYNGAAYEAEVVQGQARGWGMIFTYLYIVYFTVLLIHRERRDESKCARKYGKDWAKYKSIVKYRIIPGIY